MSSTNISLPAAYTVTPEYEGEISVHRARTWHRCDGGYYKNTDEHRPCVPVIAKGSIYIALKGKTKGYKHHLECAVERGLLERE